MAFASIGNAGNATTKSVTDPWSPSPFSGTVSAGNLVVAIVAVDNIQTTDGNSNTVVGITDSTGSNTWTKAREFTNGQGGAAAGACVAIFYSVLTSSLSSSNTVTVDFSGLPTNAAAITFWEFSKGAGTTISVNGSGDLANDGADPGNITISGLSSKQYLFVRGIAAEQSIGSPFTNTASYTAFVSNGTTGGGGASNMTVFGEWRILTGTGDSSDPSISASSDCASTFVALSESGASAAVTGTITPSSSETDIVAGGKTIILTITGDTWVASGATFDAQRQNIINGLDSAQSEANGWDAIVKAGLAVTDVVRTSNTVVTVTLPAFASYNITATETITATIPSTALTGGVQIVATPTFTITPTSTTRLLAALGVG